MKKNQVVYNAVHLKIDTNSIDADAKSGTIKFPNGLVLTDTSEQWNGTKYDIDSLDISQYSKRMFANHEYGVQDIVGLMENVYRRGNQIVTDGVRFAINENPTARLVYDLIVGGFLDSVSIGTQGPWPDDDEVYRDHSLMEVSWVGLPNNKNATINDAVKLSDIAAKNGLDLSKYDNKEKSNMSLIKIKNERDFAVALKYKNEADEEVETTVEPGTEVEVPETEKDSVETQLKDAEAPKSDDEENKDDKKEESLNGFTKEDLEALKTFKNEFAELKKFKDEHSAANAEEPKFDKDGKQINKGTTSVSTTKNNESELTKKIKNMGGAKRLQRAAELAFKNQLWSPEYAEINAVNKAELQEKSAEIAKLGKEFATNVVTMADDSFGGLVPSYELLSEIAGVRTSYDELLSVFTFTPIDRLQYAWNLRVGDIDMQPVEFCDDDEDGNLKPISEYGLNQETRNLEELAAVTPVCNAATLFAVGDLLADIAEGYRNDQRRKFASLVVAELEKAVETRVAGKSTGGAAIPADPDGSTSATNGIEWKSVLLAMANLTEADPNGVLVFSNATYAVLQAAAIEAGVVGGGKVELYTDEEGPIQRRFLGHRVVLVPNDLMPTLGTSETRTIVVNGQTVTVNHAIFYTRANNWRGVTHSSGLQYDLSRDASYEVNTGTAQSPVWRTRSAYQRNELVLRGSFFRGGGVKDFREVAGILAQTVPAES